MSPTASDSPSQAPLRIALGVVAGTIVVCFVLSLGRPLSGTLRVVGAGLALVTLLGIWACLHRARLRPEEALAGQSHLNPKCPKDEGGIVVGHDEAAP